MRDIFLGLFVILALCSMRLITSIRLSQNNPPIVKILAPIDKGKYDLNTLLHYRIKVSDQEDGESDYDEIASNEVFLEVRYLSDPSKALKATLASPDPKGLATMKKSNCFTCHAMHNKLIAPSFNEITKHYAKTTANIELLSKRVREGSSGVWGITSMPTHSELTIQETRDAIIWILESAKDMNLNYYVGKEGNIKLQLPDDVGRSGVFILSATYSDHGAKNNPQQVLTSKDAIVLYPQD
jgi:cytochrome c